MPAQTKRCSVTVDQSSDFSITFVDTAWGASITHYTWEMHKIRDWVRSNPDLNQSEQCWVLAELERCEARYQQRTEELQAEGSCFHQLGPASQFVAISMLVGGLVGLLFLFLFWR